MNLHPQLKIEEAGAGLEDKREGEIVGEEAGVTHEAVEFEGLLEAVIGDEATDHGVPEEDIGVGGAVEEETGMEGVAGFEAGAQDDVE